LFLRPGVKIVHTAGVLKQAKKMVVEMKDDG